MGGDDAQPSGKNWAAVAEAVRARLKELKITQMALATQAGVSLATIQELVKGLPRRRQPRTLTAISEALGWEPDQIASIASGGTAPPRTSQQGVDAELRAIRQELARINRRLDALEADPPEGER